MGTGTDGSSSQAREAKRAMNSLEDQCSVVKQFFPKKASLCPQGNFKWSDTDLQMEVPSFVELWKRQEKILPTHCCMGVNHMFALYTVTKQMRPQAVIESGIAAGHQTWLLRQVLGEQVPIFALDPTDPAVGYNPAVNPIGNWKDREGGSTTYMVGPKFQDLATVNWGHLIPDPLVRANTLVVLDDHQSCLERMQTLQSWGFRWIFYEDNYPFAVATSADTLTCLNLGSSLARTYTSPMVGDAYSPNALCGAPLPAGTTSVLYKAKFGMECQQISPAQHSLNVQFMQQSLESYFEFPPLFTTCPMQKRGASPILGQDLQSLQAWGLPDVDHELWHYGHLFPSFLELKLPGGVKLPPPGP